MKLCLKTKRCAAMVVAVFLLAAVLPFALTGRARIEADAAKYELSDTVVYSEGFLKSAPTIVSEITDSRSLYYVSADNDEMAAVNAWYYLDADGNVTTPEGKVIESLEEALEETDGKVIPNVYVSSSDTATAFLEWAEENTDFMDMAVISSSKEILQTLRAGAGRFRRIFDCSSQADPDLSSVAREANEAGAMIVVLGAQAANKRSVDYLQSRMKTVWVKMEDPDGFDIAAGIASGAFGLVTDGDPSAISEVYDGFSENGSTVSRSSLNIAHRGDPYHYNENSMEGFIASAEGGATHIEVDAQLTSDDQIVIMHDATIDRTTNGSGTIGRMTLEQLRQYKIVKNIGGTVTGTESDIPTIDELFTYFKDKETLLFFEIKTNASTFAQVFKRKIEECGMEDRIVVISFDRTQLASVRENIPYLWALDLNYSSVKVGQAIQEACERDVGLDASYGYISASTQRSLLDRGFMPAYWTYGTQADVETAIWNGVYGITNNDAVSVGSIAKELVCDKTYTMKKAELASGVYTANILDYNGDTEEVICEVFAYRDNGDHGEIILTYDVGRWSVLSDVIRVTYEKDSGTENGNGATAGGCASSGFAVGGSLLVAGVAILLKKKRS